MSEQIDIIELVEQGLGECSVEIEGTTGLGQGFMGDVKFLKVVFNEPTKDGKEVHMVAKMSKSDPEMREIASEIYKNEVTFFDEIIPVLYNFQNEKDMKEPFDAIPKSYKTITNDKMEMILLENMKKKGFEMHPRNITMNINHIKLVLKNYAKFHAISLALNDQRRDVFKSIENSCRLNPAYLYTKFEDMMNANLKRTIQILNEIERYDLSKKFQDLLDLKTSRPVPDIVKNTPKERVVIHGDSNSNNFLFKYQINSRENPSDVTILDFQNTHVNSPMIDVAGFLYSVASKEELLHFDELLKSYHDELSSYLTQLGSDPDEVFPASAMQDHWKKYSMSGFMFGILIIQLFSADEAPASVTGIIDRTDLLKMNEENKARYVERLIAISEHYFSCVNDYTALFDV